MFHLQAPPGNWSGGDTVFAAFEVLDSPGTFEVFVAVGRPGEPYRQPLSTVGKGRREEQAAAQLRDDPGAGVKINR